MRAPFPAAATAAATVRCMHARPQSVSRSATRAAIAHPCTPPLIKPAVESRSRTMPFLILGCGWHVDSTIIRLGRSIIRHLHLTLPNRSDNRALLTEASRLLLDCKTLGCWVASDTAPTIGQAKTHQMSAGPLPALVHRLFRARSSRPPGLRHPVPFRPEQVYREQAQKAEDGKRQG